YFDLADAYDAYGQRTAAQIGESVVQYNSLHGKYVAENAIQGIQATESQPGVGTADVLILPIRDTDGSGRIDSDALIRGVLHAADHGAAVINLSVAYNGSFGEPTLSYAPYTTLGQAIQYAGGRGAVVVSAAGNNGYNDGTVNHGVNIDDPHHPYP